MRFLMENAFRDFISELQQTRVFQLPRFIEHFEKAFEREGFRSNVPNNPPHILVIRLDAIGDNVLNSGFLRELRRNYPLARITLCVNPVVRSFVELCPYVNEVIAVSDSRDLLIWLQAAMQLCREKLWRERFDMCFIPRWGTDYYFATMLGFLSGAKNRIAYSVNVNPMKARNNVGNDLLLNTGGGLINPPMLVHECDLNMFVLRAAGLTVQDTRNEVWLSHADRNCAEELMADFVRERRAITVACCSMEHNKNYPPELFAQALKLISAKDNCCFVFVGGKADTEAGEYLRRELGEHILLNLAGRTTLRETGAAIELTSLYLGSDTSSAHIAAALQKPVVTLNRESIENKSPISHVPHFSPWQTKSIIIRPKQFLEPCKSHPSPSGCGCAMPVPHCITQIKPIEIAEAFDKILSQ